MTSELRGRRIYLVLAAITVMVKLGGFFPPLNDHYSHTSMLLPIVIALSVVFLWRGTIWIQRLAGGAFILSGAFTLLRFVHSATDFEFFGVFVLFTLILGLVDVLAGVAILKLPALNVFFCHQREGKPEPKAPVAKPQVGAACLWGLILSSGAALLLALKWAQSFEFAVDFRDELLAILGGMGAFALLGVVAGFAVGSSSPGRGTTRRYVVTRGLIAAGACVVAGVLGAAIYGGLYGQASSDFPADPGWPRAGMWAIMWLFLASPMLASAGMALGVPIALLIREDEVDLME